MTSLIVFDLDGTLIDSRRDLANAANALILERGGRQLPEDAIVGMVGEGAALLVQRALTGAGLPPDLDTALPRFLELYDQRLLDHTTLYPGTGEMLDALAAQATLAVLTNKPQRPTDRILDALAIAGYFQTVTGGDTPLGRKPDPAGLRAIVSRAGAEASKTVLVGDSAIDLRTARAAGTKICLVSYGFGFPLAAAERSGDEPVAASPAGVTAILGHAAA